MPTRDMSEMIGKWRSVFRPHPVYHVIDIRQLTRGRLRVDIAEDTEVYFVVRRPGGQLHFTDGEIWEPCSSPSVPGVIQCIFICWVEVVTSSGDPRSLWAVMLAGGAWDSGLSTNEIRGLMRQIMLLGTSSRFGRLGGHGKKLSSIPTCRSSEYDG